VSTESLALTAADALALALHLSLPALGACLAAGLIVGFLQSATQTQDASIGFLPKLAAVSGALLLTRAVAGEQLMQFCSQVLRHIASVAH
jgi:type III secretory pathway component EscS